MTETLELARALMEHFKSEVVPQAWIAEGGFRHSVLSIPVLQNYTIVLSVFATSYGLRTEVDARTLPMLLRPDDIARIGGMLIQISNLVSQIRTLAGGNANDSDRVQAAVR